MKKVILTCGKICSGKSHYAGETAKDENALILSVDELMLAVHGECLGDKHKQAENMCLRYLLKKAAELSALDVNVIVDYGFPLRSERDYAREYLSSRGVEFEWVYLSSEDSVRKKRLNERNAALTAKATLRIRPFGSMPLKILNIGILSVA